MLRNAVFFVLGIAEGVNITLDIFQKISHGPSVLATAMIAAAAVVLGNVFRE